jgi:hypothetical protein
LSGGGIRVRRVASPAPPAAAFSMHVVYSLSRGRRDGSQTVFDFCLSERRCAWFRHEFDPEGRYEAVLECSVAEIREALVDQSPASFIVEMRAAADALERVRARLLALAEDRSLRGLDDDATNLAARAEALRRERLRILEHVVEVCDAVWSRALDELVEDPPRLRGRTPVTTMQLMRRTREAVRRTIDHDYPERRARHA